MGQEHLGADRELLWGKGGGEAIGDPCNAMALSESPCSPVDRRIQVSHSSSIVDLLNLYRGVRLHVVNIPNGTHEVALPKLRAH